MPFGPKSIGNLDVWRYDAEQWDNSRITMGEMITAIERQIHDLPVSRIDKVNAK